MYDKLVAKINAFGSTEFVFKNQYKIDKSKLEMKIDWYENNWY